jgi:protein involved in polysaccharide export with SLBB domain
MVQMANKINFFSSKKITLVLFFFFSINLFAQLPSNMSNIKSKDISDVQLQEFVQKATGSGLSEAQIIEEFSKRGMPASEINALKGRIGALSAPANTAATSGAMVQNSGSKSAVPVSGQPANVTTIFGSELFSNPSLSFEPDLRIPTPKNYILGPDDQLLLDVYGVNLSQQKLVVDAEGNVYVKYAGPIPVNGLTLEDASKVINKKLAKFYPAIASSQTKVQLTVTGIRSIKIIVLGAVKKPGTYSLTSLATLFNALYVSGGPNDNGSFRNIELVRNNKVIVKADLYDFLLNSNQKSNVRLMDNDVIKIPFVQTRIALTGELNRPGLFEMQPNETLDDAIRFAGGYKSNAFKARITGIRNTDFERKVIDVTKPEIATFKPQNGDAYSVGSLLDKYENRIIIDGAVFKPGTYALEKGLTVAQLLQKAEGLREDAYTERVIIIRTREDLTKEYISVNLNTPLGKNLLLQKEDVIKISSIFDIKEKFAVTIEGAVRKPGSYGFEDSLSLKSLLLMAGGFADNATGKNIEISRRKRDVEVNNPQSLIVEIIKVNDTTDLSLFAHDIKLQAFDIISVKVNPFYKPQINVSIAGEVLNPGTYTLQNRSERISDLIKRAGNILYTANLDGAKLIRRNYLSGTDLETIEKIAMSGKDSSGTLVGQEKKPYREISIALTNILNKPGTTDDIFLEESDQIIIPIKDNMVSVYGEVFKPITISYETTKKLKNYIYDAGGITTSANKQKIFVMYPNGKASNIKHTFLFFRKYPKITAGAKIFVPMKPEKKGTDTAKAGIIISSISAFITAAALAYQITK